MLHKTKIALSTLALALSGYCFLSAQENTISLDAVTIVGNKEKFQIGSKIERIDSVELEKVSGCSLSETMTKYMPVYVKQDADGLSSVRFRGTGANHTAVLYDGINLNSLTLGQTNLSHIPMFLFNDVSVQFGGASSIYGTDAIGGSITVGNSTCWNKGLILKVQQDFGSFGHYFTGLKVNYSNQKIDYKLGTYHFHKKNDFAFGNTVSGTRDTTHNAANDKFGILQELNLNLRSVVLFAKIWYEHDARETQLDMYTNYYGGSQDYISDKYLRAIVGARFYHSQHKLTANIGYVGNYELYNRNHAEKIETNSYLSNLEYYNSKILKGELLANVKFQHIVPDMYAYDENLTENRCEISTAYKVDIFKCLAASACLHESMTSDYKSQFSPSANVSLHAISKTKVDWNFSGNISKSYKIPTFNDRFWQPGGNPDLKHETGMNYEIGSKLEYKCKTYNLRFNVNAYLLKMKNLIQWAPTKEDSYIWMPQNVESTKNKGIELGLSNHWTWSDCELELNANYAFCNAYDVSSKQQLIYTPKHLANANCNIRYKKWRLLITNSYTGTRTTETQKTLNDYFITDVALGKTFIVKKNSIDLNVTASNIFGIKYQNQENYAMPERDFGITLKYNFCTEARK